MNKLYYILDYIFCLLIVQPIQFIFYTVYVDEIFSFNKYKQGRIQYGIK